MFYCFIKLLYEKGDALFVTLNTMKRAFFPQFTLNKMKRAVFSRFVLLKNSWKVPWQRGGGG